MKIDRKDGRQLTGPARQAALEAARDWAKKNRPMFDQMDADGAFLDSPARYRKVTHDPR